MTRINVGYPVNRLTAKHLIAEHREIKRVPNIVKTGKIKLDNIPEKFCLGTGHIKFFVNKLGYLLHRYKELYQECKTRGYNVQDYSNAWDGIPTELMQDWSPTLQDKKLIINRINEKNKSILSRTTPKGHISVCNKVAGVQV